MGTIVDLRPGRTPQRAKRAAPPAPSKKPLPLRARRRRARFAWLFALLVLLALLVYGVHWASYLPRLNIAAVEVSGASAVSAGLIEQYADSHLHDGSYHFFSHSNIFVYPKAALARDIVADFPGIRAAEVSRDGIVSNTLSIRVEERAPFAQWCEGPSCYIFDDSGFLYAPYDASSTAALPNGYVFFGALASSTAPVGQTFIPGHMPGVVALLNILQQQTGLSPRTITIEGEQDLRIEFSEGFELKASFGADASTLARNLKLVFGSDALQGREGDIEYIDLRFGDRVFYKLKGEEQESVQ
jgi:cell division septal protein FtsQ